jgi:hypothetical protein
MKWKRKRKRKRKRKKKKERLRLTDVEAWDVPHPLLKPVCPSSKSEVALGRGVAIS